MTQNEKEQIIACLDWNKCKVFDDEIVKVDETLKLIDCFPTEIEEVKELYAIKNITDNATIWNARGSAYKEIPDVNKKIDRLRKDNGNKEYKIITYRKVEEEQ